MTIETAIPEPTPGLTVSRARLRVGETLAIALALALNVAAIAGGVWVGTNLQRVADQFAVWQFTPSAALESYVERAHFSDEGRFLFYASRPVIAADTDFNEVCANQTEDVGILGCYLRGDKTIFLFDVADVRLDGLEEVVAGHEMLHAAWDRMSDSQREELGVLLELEATKHAGEPQFAETLEFYAQAEPGERLNELHSIVGTEFADISPALEAHYATYFTDRSVVVALHEASSAVFEEQRAAIEALTAQIDGLAASIESDYASYNAQYEQLNADVASFNARAESGDFDSQSQFNAERNALIARQSTLDAFYASIDGRVAQYNSFLQQLEELNAVVASLNEAINITPHESAGSVN